MNYSWSIGERVYPDKMEINFASHSKILDFQKQYIDVWKHAYAGALAGKESNPRDSAKNACDEFYEAFGRPNKLYFSSKEYSLIKKDIEDHGL